MDDRQIRICFQVFLSMALIVILFFITPSIQCSAFEYMMMFIGGLLSAALFGYLAPMGIHFISDVFGKLIYGSIFSDHSYEYRFYQDDMDKAKRLTREGEFDKAILTYREIIEKTPLMCEPRFNLAQIYEKAGYPGLALNEYNRIVALKDQFGAAHAFVLESERAIEELRGRISKVGQNP